MSEDDTGQARPHPWDFCERWARGLRDKGFPGVFAHIAGVLLVLLGVPTALMVISASLWLLWGVTLQILGGGVAAEGATSNPLTDFRGPALILAGALTAPFIIWRALIADRAASAARQQAETAQTTNITTRINEAVKMLGAEKTVKKISVSLVQNIDIAMFSGGHASPKIMQIETTEGCPLVPGATLHKAAGPLSLVEIPRDTVL